MAFETAPPATKSSWMTRLGWALGGLLVVWALLWLAVPQLATQPLQFALYNVQVTNGPVNFTDALPSGARVRKGVGRLNVALLDAPVPVNAIKKVAEHEGFTLARGLNGVKPTATDDNWKLTQQELQIRHGQVRNSDENFKPAAAVTLAEIDVQVSVLQWPKTGKAIAFNASANAPKKGKALRLQLQGAVPAQCGATHVQLSVGARALARGVVVNDFLAAHRFPAKHLFLDSVKVDTAAQIAGNMFQSAAELALTHC